ncbi:MAG TPA: winged helix-turn-helix domain-containing protein [Candidatus Omnitrophota bacterium]|nr:winged helix-turn-helix domain-containing protein [Candidatus Omnitrophota bacterium]
MITTIGLCAGDIWNYLDQHRGAAKLDELVNGVGRTKERDVALMSIGWLAREGHVVLEGDGPNYTVKLTVR